MTSPPGAERRSSALKRPRSALLENAAAGFLPGALAGIHLAALLFFLNPDLPFQTAPLARVALHYGGLVGLVSLALNLPFTWNRAGRARRALPWELTAALAASALLDWTHASYYAYFLPSGINDRLIKAAIWLTLGALIGFYTALLHTLHARPYGVRSRSGYVALCLLSVFVIVERRGAFRPRSAPRFRPTVVESTARPQLLVVGIDTATLDAILPLAGQGRLPFFARMLHDGAYARLESLSPARRESLWLSLATGKYPWKHGVTGGRTYPFDLLGHDAELRLIPVGIGFSRWGISGGGSRVPRFYDRRALALWEILPRLGVPAGDVGWPASSPASREAVFSLSDRLFSGSADGETAWPRESGIEALRLRPSRSQALAMANTSFGAITAPALVQALADDSWRLSAAGTLLDRHPEVGALCVVLPGLQPVSRAAFGGYEAVQFGRSPSQEALVAAKRLTAYYSRLDSLLAEVWESRDGPRMLAVVSAYGIEGSRGVRKLLGALSQGGAIEGRSEGSPDGVFLLLGEGVRAGALLTDAELVDVAPTLLYGLGFPVARDLDGQVLTSAFDKGFLGRHPMTFLPSYEALTRTPAVR